MAPGRGLGDCSLSPLCSLCSTAGAWCRETLPGEGLFKEKHASLWNCSMKVNCAKPLFAIQTQRYNIPPSVVARRPWIHHVTLGILSLLCRTETGMLHSSPFAASDQKLSEAGLASYTHGPCLAQWTLILAGHYCNTQ